MAETVVLVAKKREERGSRQAGRLRAQGQVPGVVYGHRQETLSVSLPVDGLDQAIRQGARVIDLQTDGGTEKVLIREVQWDHLGKDILHVDFNRVSADERIRVVVPIELRGVAPGVLQGGLLDQPLHSLHVECLALSIPESIRVNIAELQKGAAVHVKELKLPEGVKVLDEPDAVVVHITTPQAEPEAGAEAGEQVEPEVIGRAKEEEGEEK